MSTNGDDGGETTIINRTVRQVTEVRVPGWIQSRESDLRRLTAGGTAAALSGVAAVESELVDLASHAETLTAFASDPTGFILTRILAFFLSGFLTAVDYVAGVLEQVAWTVGDGLILAGSAVLSSLGSGGDSILDAISSVNVALAGVASAAAPAGFAGTLFIWIILIGLVTSISIIIVRVVVLRG